MSKPRASRIVRFVSKAIGVPLAIRLRRIVGFCAALATTASGSGPEQRPLAFDDLDALREVREATINPQGSHVAFTLASTDPATKRLVTHVWLVPTTGGDARPFTNSNGSEWHPRFSADGTALAFLSDRDGMAAVWWMPTGGGEARSTHSTRIPATDFAWSPDGSRFVVVAFEPSNELGGLARPGVRVSEKSSWESAAIGSRAHLFLVPLGDGNARALTSGPSDDFDPTFTPDGKSIVFASNRSADAQHPSNTDLFVVTASGGEPRALTTTPATECAPAVSPDGKSVSFLGCACVAGTADDDALFVMPIEGGAAANVAASGLRVAGVRSGDAPRWSADGARLYFGAIEGGDTTIWQCERENASPRRLVLGPGDNLRFSIAARGNRLAFVRSEVDQPPDVWIAALDAPDLRRLTDVNRAVLSTLRLAPSETVRVRAADGGEVEAVLVKPAGYESSKRFPAAVCLAGSRDRSFRAFAPTTQLLAASGYAVILAAAERTGGGAAIAALDVAVERGIVDTDRVGLVAGAEASAVALDLLASTSRFRAAVLGAGSNELSAFADRSTRRFSLDPPWRAVRRAATAVTRDIVAPTLALEIRDDDPVWSIEAAELVGSLRSRGFAAQLYRAHRDDRTATFQRTMVGWFDEHLKEKPAAPRGQ